MTTTIKLINIYIISHNYLPPPFLLWTSLASHLLPLLSTNTWICLVIHSRGFPQCLRLSLWALSLLCNCLSRFFSLKASGCCSVVPLRLTLRDPMYCSMPGFPVLNCTPEFAETHVHWVNDAIQPSYPLLPPSPPALNLSQRQRHFQWVSSSAVSVYISIPPTHCRHTEVPPVCWMNEEAFLTSGPASLPDLG